MLKHSNSAVESYHRILVIIRYLQTRCDKKLFLFVPHAAFVAQFSLMQKYFCYSIKAGPLSSIKFLSWNELRALILNSPFQLLN